MLHPHHSVSEYNIDTSEGMEYTTIQKGRGYVYAHRNQLYERVRTVGGVKYLKCSDFDTDLTPNITRHSCIISAELVVSSFVE